MIYIRLEYDSNYMYIGNIERDVILIIPHPSRCYPVTPYTIMDGYLVFEGAVCGLCLDGMTAGQFIIM